MENAKNNTLRIPCTKKWFKLVKQGHSDYRPCNDYWSKRIENKKFDTITFTLGYPKKEDAAKHYVIPFRGYYKADGWFVIHTS